MSLKRWSSPPGFIRSILKAGIKKGEDTAARLDKLEIPTKTFSYVKTFLISMGGSATAIGAIAKILRWF